MFLSGDAGGGRFLAFRSARCPCHPACPVAWMGPGAPGCRRLHPGK